MGLGAIFAIGTTAVILDDVRQGAEFTSDHVMTVLVILGTIAAGHMLWPTIKAMKLMSAVGLMLVFLGGTYFCVAGSAGRSAKVLQHREAEATKVLDARKDIGDELKKAREARAVLSATYAKECSSGAGSRCKGLKEALATADDQVRLYEVRFDGLKPAEQANGELRYTAELVALVVKAPVQEIEKAIGLITPLAKALILELATIVFFGLGFGHTKVSEISTPKGDGGDQKPKLALPAPATIEDPVILAIQKWGSLGNKELADELGVSEGQASKLVSARAAKLRRERIGREVRISLATH